MTTLNLNKQSKGYYSKRIGNVEITVSNPLISCGMGANEWQGFINDWSNSDEEFNVFKVFASTKKEVYKAIINELER